MSHLISADSRLVLAALWGGEGERDDLAHRAGLSVAETEVALAELCLQEGLMQREFNFIGRPRTIWRLRNRSLARYLASDEIVPRLRARVNPGLAR